MKAKTYKSFNTGRPYSDQGQQIIFSVQEHSEPENTGLNRIVFADITRGISGEFTHVSGSGSIDLMGCYDGPTPANHAKRDDLLDLENKFTDVLKEFSVYDNWHLVR